MTSRMNAQQALDIMSDIEPEPETDLDNGEYNSEETYKKVTKVKTVLMVMLIVRMAVMKLVKDLKIASQRTHILRVMMMRVHAMT